MRVNYRRDVPSCQPMQWRAAAPHIPLIVRLSRGQQSLRFQPLVELSIVLELTVPKPLFGSHAPSAPSRTLVGFMPQSVAEQPQLWPVHAAPSWEGVEGISCTTICRSP